jgi:putative NADPH-quinone reductase
MKRLIIKAHPARYGFTHKIVERIGKKLSEGGGEFFVMDLYSKD